MDNWWAGDAIYIDFSKASNTPHSVFDSEPDVRVWVGAPSCGWITWLGGWVQGWWLLVWICLEASSPWDATGAALGPVLFNISSGELGRSQRELCQICRWIQGCGAGVDSAWSGGNFRVLWEAQGQHSAWLRLRNCFCFSKAINKP